MLDRSDHRVPTPPGRADQAFHPSTGRVAAARMLAADHPLCAKGPRAYRIEFETAAAAPSLRDSLAASRLAHRESRLRLVLTVLQGRVRELENRGERVPEGLLEATKGFQEDLADVRACAAELETRLAVPRSDLEPGSAGSRR